jgi:hypothetical protein
VGATKFSGSARVIKMVSCCSMWYISVKGSEMGCKDVSILLLL